MRNVLLLVHDDDGQEARFQVGLDLTRALGGHLTCLDVTYVPPVMGGIYFNDAYAYADLLTEGGTREKANKARLQERLTAEDVPWDWVDVTGDLSPSLREHSALADVIVVNRRLDLTVPDMREVAGDLVVRSRKPVLAVPPVCPRLDLGRALVAWDGSPCSAVALRAAVPLLRLAGDVVILEAQDGSVRAPAEDAAAYLSRHEIPSSIRRVLAHGSKASDVIYAELKRQAVSVVVMGGFGHHRFTEALFGGVTRDLLTNSPVPVFLAH